MATESKLVKASMVCAVLSLVFAVLPLLSAWFLVLIWMTWVFAVPAVVCAAIAMVKQKDYVKPGIAIGLVVLAILMPRMFSKQYEKSVDDSMENVGNMMRGTMGDVSPLAGEDAFGSDSDYEW